MQIHPLRLQPASHGGTLGGGGRELPTPCPNLLIAAASSCKRGSQAQCFPILGTGAGGREPPHHRDLAHCLQRPTATKLWWGPYGRGATLPHLQPAAGTAARVPSATFCCTGNSGGGGGSGEKVEEVPPAARGSCCGELAQLPPKPQLASCPGEALMAVGRALSFLPLQPRDRSSQQLQEW